MLTREAGRPCASCEGPSRHGGCGSGPQAVDPRLRQTLLGLRVGTTELGLQPQPGKGPEHGTNASLDDDMMCVVEIPERRAMVTKRVLKTPASVRETPASRTDVVIPAPRRVDKAALATRARLGQRLADAWFVQARESSAVICRQFDGTAMCELARVTTPTPLVRVGCNQFSPFKRI